MKRLFTAIILSATASTSTAAVRFAVIGDYGANTAAEGQVATLVHSWNPDFVITTGDNSYGSNDIDLNIGQFYSRYIGAYTGWFLPGSPWNRFFPSLGNHDYSDGGGITAYLSYITLPGNGVLSTGTSGNPRYYDFVIGPVHFFAINSNFQEPDGIAFSSTQALWLRDQLAQSEAPWKVVYFHHPPFSSASHGSNPVMQWPFEDWGASIVLGGHDHTYERLMRDDNADDDSSTYIVNGLGGRSIYLFPALNLVPGSKVRYNGAYGANYGEATDSTLMLTFVNTAGTVIDSIMLHRSTPCCVGTTGNVNGIGGIDLLDLSALIGSLTSRYFHLSCLAEADLAASGRVDLSDLSVMIAFLEGSLPVLPNCSGPDKHVTLMRSDP